MQMDLEELLTSSQGDSPASRGQSQGLKRDIKMTVTSGQKWLPLLKTYNLSGPLEKMSEALSALELILLESPSFQKKVKAKQAKTFKESLD